MNLFTLGKQLFENLKDYELLYYGKGNWIGFYLRPSSYEITFFNKNAISSGNISLYHIGREKYKSNDFHKPPYEKFKYPHINNFLKDMINE